jgi:hypothetical protein
MTNIIILIIDSDCCKEHVEMRDIWKKYMNTHPYIKSFFIRNNPNIGCDVLINEESNTIFVNGFENYVPGIFNKTVESIRYCLNNFNFDYIFRTNLSSFLILDKLYNFICSNNYINYGGAVGFHNNISFASGCGLFLSKNACDFLVKYDKSNIYQYPDDVLIGFILTQKYKLDAVVRIEIGASGRLDSPYLTHAEINAFHYRCNIELGHHLYTVEIMNTLYNLFLK